MDVLKNQSSENTKSVYILINAQIYPIEKSITTIGRRLDNDLVIQDILISRYHAEIHKEDHKHILYDLGSTGGTYINNQKIDQGVLYSGDLILLSNVPLMFIDETGSLTSDLDKTTGSLRNKL